MKQRKAERLTGCEIRRIGGASAKVSYGAYDADGNLVAEATHAIEDLALEFLVKKVYQVHSVQALKDNNWRCARCRGAMRLQIHHRRYRSHGGTHRVENLEPVCAGCHKVIHRLERSK
jgi:rRNA maturation endonuclease Nob1